MAGIHLDNTGKIKMQVLEEAMMLVHRLNMLVEEYALAVRTDRGSATFIRTIRRTLPSLADNLKNHFGNISDLVFSVNLASSRGASEAVRVRQLREGVGQIKQAIEVGMNATKERHAVREDKEEEKEEKEEEEKKDL